jgi:hypothetical protein
MLEFLKVTPQKGAIENPTGYPSKADYGKKTVILSCDPATLGDIGPDNKAGVKNYVIKLARNAC